MSRGILKTFEKCPFCKSESIKWSFKWQGNLGTCQQKRFQKC